eukprot:3679257-Pleurochrysis_carterae.AAC.1
MASYPSIDDDPGLDPRLALEDWKHERVLEELAGGWSFKTQSKQHENWSGLLKWHAAYHKSDSTTLGVPIKIAPNCELRSTLHPW